MRQTDQSSMPAPPRFIVDAMLGSTARKLRILGFDTLYFRGGGDADLEAVGRKERRILLTADRALFEHSLRRGNRAILVGGKSDRARLISIMTQARPESAFRGAKRVSRCAVCNGELEVLKRSDAANEEIPAKVLARHRLFFRCMSCAKLYWRGGHWDRIRRLSSSLAAKTLT
jgi:uncharacterized protein with PIN domain